MLCQSPDEPRMVHLAVNPWAWASGVPPAAPLPPTPPTELPTPAVQTQAQASPQNLVPDFQAYQTPYSFPTSSMRPTNSSYILILHNNALRALSQTPPLQALNETDMHSSKLFAKVNLELAGRAWPSIFDEDFPPSTGDQGARYETVTIQ